MKDEVSIMGVWGMGGVGKTALLKHIHNKLLNHNHHVIWITVSQNDSTSQLQRAIAMSIDENILKIEDELKIAARLLSAFKKMKKCVVILDDVWRDISLEDVGIPPRDNGIKIIVASRLLDVCKRIGCKQNIVNVECLSWWEAFTLFSKSLGDDVTLPKDIEKIAKDLTRECGGLPLAIVTMARSMRGKADIREWGLALSKLKSPEMDHNDIKRYVFPVLKSSFDHLNERAVQDCFLCLPLYIKDYETCRDDLIRIFVDEGLSNGRQSNEAQLDEGHVMLNKLTNNSLLEAGKVDNCLRLHRLVSAMALNIGKESHRYMYKEEFPDEREWEEDLQKISLICHEITEIPMSPKCPRLSTLRMCGTLVFSFQVIPDNFFINMPSLKILDLSYNKHIIALPASISNSECLTVLLFFWCKSLRQIPSLGKLRQLKRLDLSCTAITQLPQGFENLTNLRWLHLGEIAVMKAQDLERLQRLESIVATFVDKDEFNAFIEIIRARINSGLMRGYFLRLVDGPGEYVIWDNINIDRDKTVEMEGLEHSKLLLPSDINVLAIRGCNQWRSLCDVLSIQQSNNKLHISRCRVCSCNELEYLFCSSVDCILCSSLHGLNELRLVGLSSLSMLWKQNEVASSFLPFSRLTKLSIWGCNGMKKLLTPGMSTQLHDLEEISVDNCQSMEEIFSTFLDEELCSLFDIEPYEEEAIILPKLKSMYLRKLPQLNSICKGIIVCSSPKIFSIAYCPKLECVRIPIDIDILNIEDCSQWKSLCDVFSIQQGNNTLHISNCSVKRCNELECLFCSSGGCSLCSSLQGLSELHLLELNSLSMLWKENEVASSFLPFSHLTKLSISGCNGLKKLLTPWMSTQLHNLEEIRVWFCESMEEIFSTEKSRAYEVGMDDSNVEAINLPKLKSVSLGSLHQLNSVCEGIIVCGSLQKFYIHDCPKLKCAPQTQPPFEIQVKDWLCE